MELVQLVRGEDAEQVHVQHVDLRRPFDAVGRRPVGGHVERLVDVLRVVEVVRRRQAVGAGQVPVQLAEQRVVVDRVIDRLPFVLAAVRAEEVQQGEALTVGAAVDQRFVGADRRRADRARRADRLRQVGALQVLADAFEGEEVERLVALHRPADRAAELLAVEISERLAVGGVRRQPFEALMVEERSLHVVGARLGHHVDDAAGGAAEFGRRAVGDDLEFLDRFEGDVDRGPLSADLLAEEAVGVVAAVEADVVEDPALAGEGDLVAVRSLHDADARGEGQEILELAAEDRCRLDGPLVERTGRGRPRRFHRLCLRRHRHGFGNRGDLHRGSQADRFANGDGDVLLHERRKPRQLERHGVAPRRQLQRDEAAVAIGDERAGQVGVDVLDFDIDAREDGAAGVGDGGIDDAGGDLRLRRERRRKRRQGDEDRREHEREPHA